MAMTKMATIPENYNNIRAGTVELLKTARSAAARNVNALMTATYWGEGSSSPSRPDGRDPALICDNSPSPSLTSQDDVRHGSKEI
jgi:hypothetical protein